MNSRNKRGPVDLYGRLLGLALPIMLSHFLQMLYNLIDAFFLGKIGKEALSAPAISFNVLSFLAVFGYGISMAVTTLIAQSKGKEDDERVDFYLGQLTTILMFLSLLFSAVGLLFSRSILNLLRVPVDAFDYTLQYVRIVLCGLPFTFMVLALQASLQGIGDSMTPLLIQAMSVFLNAVLDPILIFGWGPFPPFQVKGAAFATLFSQFAGFLASLAILFRGKRGLRLRPGNLLPQKNAFLLISRIGFPLIIGEGLSNLGLVVLQGIVNTFGTAVVAAFGIGDRIISLFHMPATGFSRATAALVGQYLGARRRDLARRVVAYSLFVVLSFMTLGMALTFFKGASMIRFFVADPATIEHGELLFRVISPSLVFLALFTIISGAFQGGGDTKPVMGLSVARVWLVRLPLALLLAYSLGWGPIGLWVAMALSNLVAGAMGFYLLESRKWMFKLDPDQV